MNPTLFDLLEKTPYLFMIVIGAIIIAVLWKENKAKDTKLSDLSENVIKITAIYEEKLEGVKNQNDIINAQHSLIIEILKDIKRILNLD